MKTFEELGVSEEIRRAIEELGFENPMPVQEEVIPYLLGNKNDVIALAQTGTGKTASYGIPVIQKTDAKSKQTQAIMPLTSSWQYSKMRRMMRCSCMLISC